MHRRTLIIIGLLFVLALPLWASQFIELPFDKVAGEAQYIVLGTVGQTFSKWDDAHEVIFTYAVVHVDRYFGETTGPDTLMVREVGGTVDGYTMEAIGFPAVRAGERVVLMLSQWEDSPDLRIHAYNQGKYLVRNRGGIEVLIADPVQQGHARLETPGREIAVDAYDAPGLRMNEFAEMVEAARAGHRGDMDKDQRQ
jgi:hypothetical protein